MHQRARAERRPQRGAIPEFQNAPVLIDITHQSRANSESTPLEAVQIVAGRTESFKRGLEDISKQLLMDRLQAVSGWVDLIVAHTVKIQTRISFAQSWPNSRCAILLLAAQSLAMQTHRSTMLQ